VPKLTHAYAAELARYALARYVELERKPDPGPCKPRHGGLPSAPALEHLLSVAYQASLLREEDRPVRFRLFVGNPEQLPPEVGPPDGLHRLRFDQPRAYDEHEIRRLSPAAKFHRALIGVRSTGADGFEIWGIVQSGPRWLQSARGGRELPSPVPDDAVVVRVQGPGHIALAVGDVTVVELRAGKLSGVTSNVFESHWFTSRFRSARAALLNEHERVTRHLDLAPLDPDATRLIAQQMAKRLIATIQESRHGGTLVFVPQERCPALLGPRPTIQLKYRFAEDEPRKRYRTLILSVMRELGLAGAALDPRPAQVGWELYQGSQRPEIIQLDEAILEMSQLIAALADVDGAVLLNERFDVLGFGGEIAGSLAELNTIRRALDPEGTSYDLVPIDGVGTRHRAAYRLCAHEHEAFAVVISQDGSVQFVAWHEGAPTYWEHRNNAGTG
jgi:hypothetical protein